ncbi:MAG: S-layer protein, partial [Verrucomicrobia bacterium]|nr:S-layer protein [Verrucomicrobiota bacterium]
MRFHLLHPLLLLVASLRLLPSVEAATSKVAAPRTFNFENDISPLLTRYSCNASPCHGKAEGQNGFKLSVFGYDALADWRAFVTESKGRRSSSALPEQSLFLAKASGTLPHQGGARIPVGSPDYETIRAWLAAGAPFGSTNDARV